MYPIGDSPVCIVLRLYFHQEDQASRLIHIDQQEGGLDATAFVCRGEAACTASLMTMRCQAATFEQHDEVITSCVPTDAWLYTSKRWQTDG